MIYYLIGMMLSGKSTISKLVSDKYKIDYIDLDTYIENKYHKSINEIFNTYGESYFREIETNCLNLVSKDNKLIALGGGTPIYNKLNGIVILLNPSLDELIGRINDNEINTRPLLKDINSFIELYKKRIDKYVSIADYIIEDTNIDDIVNKIGMIINGKDISN